MEKTKFLTLAVIALLLLNVCIVAYLWLNRHPPPRMEERPNAMKLLIEDLKFDEKQKANFSEILPEHRERRRALETKLGAVQNTFFKGIFTNDTSGIEAVRVLKGAIELENFEHLQAIRNMCTTEQKVIFDSLILETLKSMKPPPPPQ